MHAVVQQRGRTVTRVTVLGATGSTSDKEIFDVAAKAAGENRSSLFGWDYDRLDDGQIAVRLHTD